jgi:hypothetical protein
VAEYFAPDVQAFADRFPEAIDLSLWPDFADR